MKKKFTILFTAITLCAGVQSYAQNVGLYFDGVDDKITTTVPPILGNGARTIEAIINTSTSSNGQLVIADMGSASGSGGRFTLNILNKILRIEIGGGGLNGTTLINDGNFHHVAVVYNPSATNKYKLYLDGAIQANGNITTALNTAATTNFIIGVRVDGANFFDGIIDEVRLYNYARTQADITADVNAQTLCNNDPGFRAYFKLDDGIAGGSNGGIVSLANAAPTGYQGTPVNFNMTGTTSNFITSKNITVATPPSITAAMPSMNCGSTTALELTSNIPVTWNIESGSLYTDATGTTAYATGTPANNVFAKANNNRYVKGTYEEGGCTFTDSAFITINNPETSVMLAGNMGAADADSSIVNNSTVSMHNSSCELMASITPTGGTPVNGWITGKVIMDGSVQNTITGPYVTRHYELTPKANVANSGANVTLYFTQAEFDAYNTYVTSNGLNAVNPLLPSNPAGIQSGILVDKFNASSGSPSPSNNNSSVAIPPTSVTWDSTNMWWAVTFPTTGFSGFFLHTNASGTPLPIVWNEVSAMLNLQKEATINWNVSEKETAKYLVQKSTDGNKFENIATVNSKGNGNNVYSFTEQKALSGKAWYRVAQSNKNGAQIFSRIMALQNSALYGQISIYPNPATQVLTVETQREAQYSIYDLQGQSVMKGDLQSGKNTLNVSGLAKGFYTIKIGDYNQKIVLQ
jgi:hypothetical protein